MKISIKSGGTGKGWSNYVTRKYVRLSEDERSKIVVLQGNTNLGDQIIKSSNYKENSTTLVLSFKGKVSDDKAKAVDEDFKKLFMSGFDTDEYHYDSVLHQDTDNTHMHIRIPTKNLLTDTQLRLYYHARHKNFINAIRDYLIIKHDLPRPTPEHKKVFSTESKKEKLIQKQRAKENRQNFDFSKKKGRDKAKKYIANYIAELHKSGLINDFNDLQEIIKTLDLNIIKIGKDITGDFNYFTVQDKESHQKIRLIGEIYNEQFWQHTREDREQQIRVNRIPSKSSNGARNSLEEAKQRLKKEVRKREEEVRKRYESSRRKSREKQQAAKHHESSNAHDNKLIDRHYIRSNTDEVATKQTAKHNTKQSARNIQNHQKALNDSTGTATTRRVRERRENRERTLQQNRERRSKTLRADRETRRALYERNRGNARELQKEFESVLEQSATALQTARELTTRTRENLGEPKHDLEVIKAFNGAISKRAERVSGLQRELRSCQEQSETITRESAVLFSRAEECARTAQENIEYKLKPKSTSYDYGSGPGM